MWHAAITTPQWKETRACRNHNHNQSNNSSHSLRTTEFVELVCHEAEGNV